MVGPGTGVAPFRGFIQDREATRNEGMTRVCVCPPSLPPPFLSPFFLPTGKEIGSTVLYFGCRHKSEDYLYEDELVDYEKKKVLSELHVAFSRDHSEKIYVQNKMKENAESVWKLLEAQGYLYICG